MKTETKSESRVWLCSECPKSFGRKGDLTRHKLLHDGYKPHKCDEPDCGKEFAQYSGLKTHKNIHTKEKPYVCGFNSCQASFGDPSSCARHRKETHRRIGGYRCPVPRCNSRIKRRSAFTAHLKRHRIDPVTLDVDSLAPPLLPASVPVPRRRSIGQLVSYDIKPKIEDLSPPRLPQARKDYYHHVQHLYPTDFLPSDLRSLGSPYSMYSGTYTSSYPTSVTSSVVSVSSHYATPSSNFELSAVDDVYWEDHTDKLYIMESPSSPSNINMHPSPSALPPPGLPAAAQPGPSSETPCNVDDQEPFNLNNYMFPPSYYMSPDYFPTRKAVDVSPFFYDPTPEAPWAFV